MFVQQPFVTYVRIRTAGKIKDFPAWEMLDFCNFIKISGKIQRS